VVLCVGCSGPGANAQHAGEAPAIAVPAPTTTAAAALDPRSYLAPGERPAWLAEAVSQPPEVTLETRDEAVGYTGSLVDTTAGWMWVSDPHGIFGPLAVPPGTVWVGLVGTDDALLAATADGALFRARDPLTATETGAFVPAGALGAAAKEWDAAGSVVAASSADGVRVSYDGGKSFVAPRPVDGEVLALFARHDGVVVARARAGDRIVTWVLGGKAGAWQRARFQANEIERVGAWIMSSSNACTVVLAKDGVSWLRPNRYAGMDPSEVEVKRATGGELPLLPIEERELRQFALERRTQPRAEPLPARATPENPAPPLVGSAPGVKGDEGPCDEAANGGLGLLGGAFGCEGVRCLMEAAGPPPRPTAFSLTVFDDGYCAPSDGTKDDWGDSVCREGAPLLRTPTLAVFDGAGRGLRAAPGPAGCGLENTFTVEGLGLLFCRASEGSNVILVDREGVLHPEGRVAATAVAGIGVSEDGTMVLVPPSADAGWLPWIRRPVAPGTAGAWRPVRVPGVLGVHAVGRGAAVVVTESKGDLHVVDLWIERPDGEPLSLVREVRFSGNLLRLDVVDGEVVLLTHPTRTWGGDVDGLERLRVRRDGTLEPL
jgi:hypothetical protein